MPLLLPDAVRQGIRAHGEEAYPEECCGAMLGRDRDDGVREIVEILRIGNTKDENRTRRYLIDPKDLLAAEKTARGKKLDVLGIYHSHPDHPSRPSEFDREHAMPFWSYVIVAVAKGKAELLTSWQLSEDRQVFSEEPVVS
jgi:proteasome lid subunit RPN8/RPN11